MQQNAAGRRGTHATKTRAMVSGSGKKPWRQKGTGRARVGEIRNPLWRKGGTVFGPQPRSYEFDLPKKVRRGALRAALAQKMQDGALVVVDKLEATEKKTKATAALLKRLGATGKTLVIDVTPEDDFALTRAQHRRAVGRGQHPRHRARRHGHDARDRDARGDREAAGVAGITFAARFSSTASTRDAVRLEWRLATGNDMKLTDIIRRPLITEKTTLLREAGRTVVFEVASGATKIDIKRAVEKLLGSKVEAVRTSISHGKFKRQGRFIGQRSDWKKAYVKLREGEKIPEFLEGA